MCLECTPEPSTSDKNGNPICQFCNTPFAKPPRLHFLQCATTQSRRKGVFTRRDRLIEHLHKKHNLSDTRQLADSGRFPVDCSFPRQCGFCDFTFQTWEERLEHIKCHYDEGSVIADWKLPRPRPRKTNHSGPSSQSRDDGDGSDDDFGGGNGKPPGKSSRPKIMQGRAKRQPQSTNRSQESGSTPQRQRRSENEDAESNMDDVGDAGNTSSIREFFSADMMVSCEEVPSRQGSDTSVTQGTPTYGKPKHLQECGDVKQVHNDY